MEYELTPGQRHLAGMGDLKKNDGSFQAVGKSIRSVVEGLDI